jgi:hypothetical protein
MAECATTDVNRICERVNGIIGENPFIFSCELGFCYG